MLNYLSKIKNFWVCPMESKEKALEYLKATQIAFYSIAALQFVYGTLTQQFYLYADAIILFVLATLLRMKKSLGAAIFLLLYSSMLLFSVLNNILLIVPFEGNTAGRKPFLPAVMLYIAIIGLKAVLKYHGKEKSKEIIKNILIVNFIALVAFIGALLALIFISAIFMPNINTDKAVILPFLAYLLIIFFLKR